MQFESTGRRFVLSCLVALLFVSLVTLACDRRDERVERDSWSPTGPSPTAQLSVSPQNVVHQTGVKQCFTASGGDGNYVWSQVLADKNWVPTSSPMQVGDKDRACHVSSFDTKYIMTVRSAGQSATARGEVIR